MLINAQDLSILVPGVSAIPTRLTSKREMACVFIDK